MPPFKRSPVWKYFEKTDNNHVKCKLCKREFKFNSSTSNMKAHLRCKDHIYFNIEDLDGSGIKNDLSGQGTSEGREALKVEQQELHYDKLVVPMSMRSIYWKCYGFPASEEGDILTNLKIVCLLCKNVISYNRNTSNLRMHLQNRHREELIELEKSLPPKSEETLLKRENSFKRKKNEGFIYSTNVSGKITIGDRTQTNIFDFQVPNEDFEASLNLRNVERAESRLFDNKLETVVTSTPNNKTQMELLVPGGDQNCTIESLHPFMIPLEKSVSDAVTEFITMDMQLPDVVEGRGFQRLIALLRSPCEIPSKTKLIEEIIPRNYDSIRLTVQQSLLNINADVTLSVEEWESICGETNITFSITYQQDKEDILVNKVLSTTQCPSSVDSQFWEVVFENLVEDWGLKLEKMKVVVFASTCQELLTLFVQRGLIVIPCLIHCLQDICTRVCFDQDDVRVILRKTRSLVGLIYNHNNALAALRIQDHLMSLEEMPLLSDYPKLWLTTYNMLEAMTARRQVIATILENIETSAYDKEVVSFTDQDWILIEEIVTVLEPFKVTMLTLGEEKTPLVSLLKPLLCQLLSTHLKIKEDDTANIQEFKASLKTALSEKYSGADLDQFLNISTTLDPRFKNLANMADESKACLDGPIKDSLVKLIGECPKDVKPTVENEPEKKKHKLGMVMMLGKVCPSTTAMSLEERSNLELIQYKSESTATLDQCPLGWWNLVATKCPGLAQLARQYTFVPAAATPPGRIALDSQLQYENKRANLTPEIVDRILFLNSNHVL